MATGGEVTGATGHQSDAVHEYTCSPCSQNHVTTSATHYCPECDVCYCKACLCDHAVLGRAKIAEWGNTATERVGNQSEAEAESGEVTCLRHVGYKVTMYCVDHDVLCCQLCSSTDHRSCKNLQKLSTAADNDNIDDTILKVDAAIARSKSNVKSLCKDSEVRKNILKSSYTNYIKQLEEVQERMNAKFDDVREEMLVHKQHYLDKLNMDQLMCNNITEELAKLKSTLEPTVERQTHFVRVKHAQELVADKDNDIKAIYDAPVTGMFVNIPRVDEAKVLDAVADCIAVKLAEMKFSVETREDKQTCAIIGMCQLANGNLVLADRANKCLKQLDTDYTVISQYKLEGIPNAVCATVDSEIVVVLDNKQILVCDLGLGFKMVRTFKVDGSCSQVAYHNGRLFVTETIRRQSTGTVSSYNANNRYNCELKTHIYDIFGKAITFWTTNTGDHYCYDMYGNYPQYYMYGNHQPVAVSVDGVNIFVAHPSGGYIVAFNSEGREVAKGSRFSSADSRFAGLCVDDQGYLHLSMLSGSTEVVTLSQEGGGTLKQIKTVPVLCDGTTKMANAICYDQKLGRVVVCPLNSNYMYLEKCSYDP